MTVYTSVIYHDSSNHLLSDVKIITGWPSFIKFPHL